MTIQEAIKSRHSVRKYKEIPIEDRIAEILKEEIEKINAEGNLHIQLILNEDKAYKNIFAYGKFSGVSNYLVIAGKATEDFDEHVGYYGERLVLLAQSIGLNTCWTGVSYKKIQNTFTLNDNEKIACYIALGYGENQGFEQKHKTIYQLSNINDNTPQWFKNGVEMAQLAPTAINQQKFYFEYTGKENDKGKQIVIAKRGFSIVGYTKMDLGIAKLHFEIGAGKNNFDWE